MPAPAERWRGLPDLSARERWAVGPLLLLTVALGIAPRALLDTIHLMAAAVLP